MQNYVATHKKAIAGAVLGAVGAAIASLTAGSSWQVVVAATVAGALGVGGGVSVAPANRQAAPPAAG